MLQDAIDLGMAKSTDADELKKWKAFRVEVYQVDIETDEGKNKLLELKKSKWSNSEPQNTDELQKIIP